VDNILEKNRGTREINFTTLSQSTEGGVRSFTTNNSEFKTLGYGATPMVSPHTTKYGSHSFIVAKRDNSNSPNSLYRSISWSDPTRYKHVETLVEKRSKTVGSAFALDMNELCDRMSGTRRHFILCMKPNAAKQAGELDLSLIMRQLSSQGTLGAVQTLKGDLPNHFTFNSFRRRYRALTYCVGQCPLTKEFYRFAELSNSDISAPDLKRVVLCLIDVAPIASLILAALRHDTSSDSDRNPLEGLKIGKTHILMSTWCFNFFERLRRQTLELIAKRFQRTRKAHVLANSIISPYYHSLIYFGNSSHYKAKKRTTAVVVIQRRVRVYLAQRKMKRMIAAFTLMCAVCRGWMARRRWSATRRERQRELPKREIVVAQVREERLGEQKVASHQRRLIRCQSAITPADLIPLVEGAFASLLLFTTVNSFFVLSSSSLL
jgi:hypothetical protein